LILLGFTFHRKNVSEINQYCSDANSSNIVDI
jgi:hypothetical protein